jgi:hypothetical protein
LGGFAFLDVMQPDHGQQVVTARVEYPEDGAMSG